MNDTEAQSATLLHEGERLLAARLVDRAAATFRRAEAIGADPDRCSAGRWTASMLRGDFEAAWQESDAIRQRGAPDPHRLWQGEPLADKRIILRCLHGFGDAVQFLRYLPRLQALASSLIVEVPPRFMELAPCFAGAAEVITWGDGAPAHAPEWDVQVEIMELPYLFRTKLNELPITSKYLHLPPGDPLPSERPKCSQVGIAWTAGPWNPSRSIPLHRLQPLLGSAGCEFWSLQGGPDAPSQEALPTNLKHDNACRNSLFGLAATIAQLDLVITVDTLAAHLAGALGVPAWLLLQHEADWRWMHDRDDCPWYPSLRLFRQPTPGNWQAVVTDVRRALHTFAKATRKLDAA